MTNRIEALDPSGHSSLLKDAVSPFLTDKDLLRLSQCSKNLARFEPSNRLEKIEAQVKNLPGTEYFPCTRGLTDQQYLTNRFNVMCRKAKKLGLKEEIKKIKEESGGQTCFESFEKLHEKIYEAAIPVVNQPPKLKISWEYQLHLHLHSMPRFKRYVCSFLYTLILYPFVSLLLINFMYTFAMNFFIRRAIRRHQELQEFVTHCDPHYSGGTMRLLFNES